MTVHVALERDVAPADLRGRPWAYLGDDPAWRVRMEDAAPGRVASADAVAEAAQRLRRPFIDWIGDLGAANDSLEWWSSELAAKNPFTHLFARLCALAAAPAVAGELRQSATAPRTRTGKVEPAIVCSTPALARAIAETVAGGAHLREASSTEVEPLSERLARRALAAWARYAPARALELPGRTNPRAESALDDDPAYRRRVLGALGTERVEGFAGDETALLVTWVDDRSVGVDGAYRDPHLGPLAAMLRERGIRVAHVPQMLHTSSFGGLVRALGASGESFAWPDLYVTAEDVADVRRRAARFRPAIAAAPDELGGEAAAALAREHVEEWRWKLARSLQLAALARRLAEAGVRPARIVFPWEGHSWEQALAWGVRRHMPGTELIGYDNVNFSRLALSLYPAQGEWDRRPLPDRVVTNGPAFTRTLDEEGWPAERVRTGCGLRHAYLHEQAGAGPGGRPAGPPYTALVATSINLGQSVEMIRKAAAAFGGEEGWRMVVKPHPALPEAEIRAAIDPPPNLEWSSSPIPALLGRADVLLYGYSIVPYEALAAGVPPVLVRSESGLDLDQLEPYPRLGGRGRTPEELRTAAEALAGRDGEWREAARASVAEALAPARPNCVEVFLSVEHG